MSISRGQIKLTTSMLMLSCLSISLQSWLLISKSNIFKHYNYVLITTSTSTCLKIDMVHTSLTFIHPQPSNNFLRFTSNQKQPKELEHFVSEHFLRLSRPCRADILLPISSRHPLHSLSVCAIQVVRSLRWDQLSLVATRFPCLLCFLASSFAFNPPLHLPFRT